MFRTSLGLGLSTTSGIVSAAAGLPLVEPSAGWNGTVGSGFGGAYGAVPTDPTRTTAKPAMRLLVPYNQYFTDYLLVGVYAGANNAGSLLTNMGLSKVVMHFEGNTVDILKPTWQTFDDANGNPVSYYGWWARLKKPAGVAGHGNVYFEAIPSDGTMQSRVIGPYQFGLVATLYDCELEVAPTPAEIVGVRYQSITNALTYIRTNTKQNTRITITEAHPSGWYDMTNAASYQGNGYHRIEATVPVAIGKAAYTTDANAIMRPRINGLHFAGSNITLDYAYMSYVYRETSAGAMLHRVDGCRMTNSRGRDSYWRLGSWPVGTLFFEGAWFTEAVIDNLTDPCGQAPPLARGCNFSYLARDLANDALCFVGNTISEHNSTFFAQDLPAFTVTYAGGEATATIELSGANDASSRTYTARWGANSATFAVGSTEALFAADTNYKFSHVVNWLNGLGVGFTAVLLDDARRASSGAKLGAKGIAIPAQSVKDTTFTVYSMIDLHSDMYQQNVSGTQENVIIANNRGWELVTQNFLLAPSSGATQDWLIINNAVSNKVAGGAYDNTDNFYSQQARAAQSHVVIAHNTFANQGWYIEASTSAFDAYCMMACNSFRTISWGGTPDADLIIKDNHLHTGGVNPSGGTGTTIGGNQTSLVADFDSGDFTPAGALLSNLKTPVVKYDINRVERAASDAAGALAV